MGRYLGKKSEKNGTFPENIGARMLCSDFLEAWLHFPFTAGTVKDWAKERVPNVTSLEKDYLSRLALKQKLAYNHS